MPTDSGKEPSGDTSMSHTVSLSDEHFARLEAAARTAHTTPDTILANLLGWLPALKAPLSAEEYAQRWDAFWHVVGNVKHGQPLTSDEIDELIGEEIADGQAGASASRRIY